MAQILEAQQNRVVIPDPCSDWLNQRELAELIGCSERTASIRAGQGLLKRYEHGSPLGGRRKYSRRLVLVDLARRLAAAQEMDASQQPAHGVKSVDDWSAGGDPPTAAPGVRDRSAGQTVSQLVSRLRQ